MSSFLAAFHYLALAMGFSGVLLRGLEFRELIRSPGSLRRLFFADNLYGIAAVLWLVTGFLRAFAGFEKGAPYYLQNHWFWAKIGLFTLIFLLELWPMVTFVKWRILKKTTLDSADVPLMAKFRLINDIELVLVLIIPFFAVAMARNGFL